MDDTFSYDNDITVVNIIGGVYSLGLMIMYTILHALKFVVAIIIRYTIERVNFVHTITLMCCILAEITILGVILRFGYLKSPTYFHIFNGSLVRIVGLIGGCIMLFCDMQSYLGDLYIANGCVLSMCTLISQINLSYIELKSTAMCAIGMAIMYYLAMIPVWIYILNQANQTQLYQLLRSYHVITLIIFFIVCTITAYCRRKSFNKHYKPQQFVLVQSSRHFVNFWSVTLCLIWHIRHTAKFLLITRMATCFASLHGVAALLWLAKTHKNYNHLVDQFWSFGAAPASIDVLNPELFVFDGDAKNVNQEVSVKKTHQDEHVNLNPEGNPAPPHHTVQPQSNRLRRIFNLLSFVIVCIVFLMSVAYDYLRKEIDSQKFFQDSVTGNKFLQLRHAYE